jgi:hypothetical protein
MLSLQLDAARLLGSMNMAPPSAAVYRNNEVRSRVEVGPLDQG